jgi:hypothetical protein
MRHIYNRICRAPGLLMSVGPPADRSAREHGPVHGWRWRTPDRRWSMSSKRSDNCGKNSSLRDYGRGRSVLRSSLGRHICLLRREPEQRRGRTCVRESYRKDCGVQRASNRKPRSARSAGPIHLSSVAEVKGTQASMPRFFITEGEPQFACANRPSYLLLVVYDIDRMPDRHRLLEHEAADLEDAFVLTPRQGLGTGFEPLRCGAGFLSHLGFSVLLDVMEHPARCVPSARPSLRAHICLARNRWRCAIVSDEQSNGRST